MRHNQTGSVLLTTLVMAFIISTLMLGMTLIVNHQMRNNRMRAQYQTSLAEMERFAEETYATFTPLMNHDGTLNDLHLPSSGNQLLPITSTINPTNCTREYTADPSNLEAGFITVVMEEECTNSPYRYGEITYQLSPDAAAVHSLLPVEPIQPLQVTSFTRTAASPNTYQARVNSSEPGYIRMYVETLDPTFLQNSYLVATNHEISRNSTVTINFIDPIPTDTAPRRLKILYSTDPFPDNPDELIRRTCATGPCGAQSVLRGNYTITGAWTHVTPPTLPQPGSH